MSDGAESILARTEDASKSSSDVDGAEFNMSRYRVYRVYSDGTLTGSDHGGREVTITSNDARSKLDELVERMARDIQMASALGKKSGIDAETSKGWMSWDDGETTVSFQG